MTTTGTNGTSVVPVPNEEHDASTKKSVPVTADDLYRRSTQYLIWSFTQEELDKMRLKVHKQGIKEARIKFDKAGKDQLNPDFEKYALQLTADALLDPPSLEEESKFLSYYVKNVIDTADYFRMPTQVKATAASFFKKFYLVHSIMEYHPKHILYTCLFLAAKSENYFMSIESFTKPLPNTEPLHVLDLEFIVLLSLKFTLLVHHPFRPLYGLFLDAQAVLLHPSPLMYDVNVDTLGALYDKLKKWLVDHAVLSDVSLLFTPPQIALAAMYDIDKRITDRYLKRKFLKDEQEGQDVDEEEKSVKVKQEEGEGSTNEDVEMKDENEKEVKIETPTNSTTHTKREEYELLVRTIRKCIRKAKEFQLPSREESTAIDKKCYFVLNPERLIKRKIKQLNTPPAASAAASPAPSATPAPAASTAPTLGI